MGWSSVGHLLLALALAHSLGCTSAYPSIFVARYQQTCTEHPDAPFGKVHGYSKALDRTVTFRLKPTAGGNPVVQERGVTTVCPGQRYNLDLAFGAPSKRNFLLTVTHGTFIVPQNDCDAWCPNRVCSVAPMPKSSAVYVVPCSVAPGTRISIKVTTANGRIPAPGSNLRSATLNLVASSGCGRCSSAGQNSAIERGPADP